MKKLTSILNELLLIAKDAKVWFRVLVFVVIGTTCFVVGASAFSKTEVKKEDCSYYIEQNKQLISALIDIKKDLQASSASYSGNGEGLMFASFDSIPKRLNKQQIQMRIEVRKIDSILSKYQQQQITHQKQKS